MLAREHESSTDFRNRDVNRGRGGAPFRGGRLGFQNKFRSGDQGNLELQPIDESVKENILLLVREASSREGHALLGSEIVPRYRERFGESLEFRSYGFMKLVDFLKAIPCCVRIELSHGGDFRAMAPEGFRDDSRSLHDTTENILTSSDDPNEKKIVETQFEDKNFSVSEGSQKHENSTDTTAMSENSTSLHESKDLLDVDIQQFLLDPASKELLSVVRKCLLSSTVLEQKERVEKEVEVLQLRLNESEMIRASIEATAEESLNRCAQLQQRLEILEGNLRSIETQKMETNFRTDGFQEALRVRDAHIASLEQKISEIRNISQALFNTRFGNSASSVLELSRLASILNLEVGHSIVQHPLQCQDESDPSSETGVSPEDESETMRPAQDFRFFNPQMPGAGFEPSYFSATRHSWPQHLHQVTEKVDSEGFSFSKSSMRMSQSLPHTHLQNGLLSGSPQISNCGPGLLASQNSYFASHESSIDHFSNIQPFGHRFPPFYRQEYGMQYGSFPRFNFIPSPLDQKRAAVYQLVSLFAVDDLRNMDLSSANEQQIDELWRDLKSRFPATMNQNPLNPSAPIFPNASIVSWHPHSESSVPRAPCGMPTLPMETGAVCFQAVSCPSDGTASKSEIIEKESNVLKVSEHDESAVVTSSTKNGSKDDSYDVLCHQADVCPNNISESAQPPSNFVQLGSSDLAIDESPVSIAKLKSETADMDRPMLFKFMSRIDGRAETDCNILEGIEVNYDVISSTEVTKISEFIQHELSRQPEMHDSRRKKSGTKQLNYGVFYDRNEGRCRDEVVVDKLPKELRELAHSLVLQGYLSVDDEPDTASIFVCEPGDSLSPHIESQEFKRSFCLVSITDIQLLMGRASGRVEVNAAGEMKGFAIDCPSRSVAIFRDSVTANHVEYAIPSSETRQINIIFRRRRAMPTRAPAGALSSLHTSQGDSEGARSQRHRRR